MKLKNLRTSGGFLLKQTNKAKSKTKRWQRLAHDSMIFY